MVKLELPINIPDNLKIFSFEGIDGAGKSTQARLVAQRLQDEGFPAVMVSSPRHDFFGENLRNNIRSFDAEERQSLFLLDIFKTFSEQEEGNILIMDRYVHSSMTSNKEMTPAQVAQWTDNLPRPNAAFWLDVTPREVFENRSQSLHDHSTDLNWQQQKYQRYEQLLRTDPTLVRVKGNLPQEELTDKLVNLIYERLPEYQAELVFPQQHVHA